MIGQLKLTASWLASLYLYLILIGEEIINDHVLLTNIIAYCQQNWYLRFAIYTDWFSLISFLQNIF